MGCKSVIISILLKLFSFNITEHCGCAVSSVLFALNLSYFLIYNKSSPSVYLKIHYPYSLKMYQYLLDI